MDLFFEIHKDIPREGPGENASTKQALLMLKDLPSEPNILDIGCGPGMQTIELAKNTNGRIIALDNHKPFLDLLKGRAVEEDVLEKIKTKEGSMFSLEFEKNSFDLLWSEGAIFIIGFSRGIKEWREYIRIGGYLVVSEISWLRQDIPQEARTFWESDYPEIKGIDHNMKIIEESGYSPVGNFVLPKSGWWNDYYNPLIERIKVLREKYDGNKEANDIMDNTEREIEIYKKYSDYYGYVFYLMKKI
ncbi:class I SAM-dependent methyltransferase [Clostridium tagluense]|uniref:class I SAM-dependent methyltransferase n=1 Tax=Clostridium tagluense TaxID=360422 RepID=UPI001CF583FB|nr:class I SAM-dependent methyltransferase [Clostridium tagluense]MCB2300752.1 class I SAM-dependent methyltransferase [Clostridium tagluense]